MSDGSDTTYRFGGDGSELIAELGRIRQQLGTTAASALQTGSTISSATSGAASTARTAAQSLQSAAAGLTSAHDAAAAAAIRHTGALGKFEKGQKLNAIQAQQLGYQLNDFFVQVSSGQGILQPLIQQGSQLSGTFGGIGGALRAVATVFSPVVLGLGAIAAVAGAVGYAFVKGREDDEEFRKGLALTNNAAGATGDAIAAMSRSIGELPRTSVGPAREALVQLASTGRFSAESLGAVGRATAAMQAVTGKSAADIVQDFVGMTNGVARWATEANKQYHYATAAQIEYIRSLEAQGKTQQAVAENARLLAVTLERAKPPLSALGALWDQVEKSASRAWDAMKGIGRADTLGQQLVAAQNYLQTLRDTQRTQQSLAQAETGDTSALDAQIAAQERVVENLKARAQVETVAAHAASRIAQDEARRIEEGGSAHQAALTSLTLAGLKERIAANQVERDEIQRGIERGYAQNMVTTRGYIEWTYSLRRASLQDELTLISQQAEAQKRAVVSTPTERVANESRLLEIQTRRVGVLAKMRDLDDQLIRHEITPPAPPSERAADPVRDFRRFENSQAAAEALRARSVAAAEAAHQLAEQNRELNIALIQDDRARGQAQIALEEERLRRTLELETLNAADRKRVEGDLADWRIAQETRLADQLKPQWQKQLDEWRDHTRLMRATFDEFQDGWIKRGEDAWVSFAKTGKLSIKSLGDFAVEQLAKFQFRDQIGDAFSKVGGTIAGYLGIKSPDAGGAQGRNTAAVESSTFSLNIFTQALDSAAARLGVQGRGSGRGVGGFLSGLFGGSGGSGTGIGGAEGSSFNVNYAKGGAFGAVQAFAQGGAFTNRTFSSPTPFTFARGDKFASGLMGENGPEAVIPLRRGPGGSLGVAAHGAGGGSTKVIVNTPPGAQVDRTEEREGTDGREVEVFLSMAEQRVASRIAQGRGPVVAALQKRGVNTDRNLARVG